MLPDDDPTGNSRSAAPPAPAKSEAGELVHQMRNCLFAMQCANDALEWARPDEQQLKSSHDMMLRQLDVLEDLVARASRLLEVKTD